MLKEERSITSNSSFIIEAAAADCHNLSSSTPIFILCDKCYWCATFFDKTRVSAENICPQCNANNSGLTSFPIMLNESFIFNHNNKRGVELEFKPRYRDI